MTQTKYGTVEPDIMLTEIDLLNLQQLIEFETAVMVHKSLNDSVPDYLTNLFTQVKSIHSHNTRSVNYGISPPQANPKFGQRSFSHYGRKVWNALPKDVQEQTNLNSFKKKFKSTTFFK